MLHKSEHPSPIVNNIRKRPECLLLAQSGHWRRPASHAKVSRLATSGLLI
jgi:hypothetical protein